MALGGGINLPTITQRFAVDDNALSGMGRRIGKIGKFLGKAVAAGAGVAAAGIGAFVVSGTKGAVQVEKGIAEVVTLFGETGDAARELGDELTEGVASLSDEVGIAQDVLVGGLYDAISAGIPKDNAFEFMRVASEASIAGVTDVGTAVDGLTSTINAFGLDASQAQEVADSMFAAVQGGKTNFEDLSGSLYNIAPAAAAAGVSFQEVNAGIATLTSGGTPTAQATTQMRAALVGLQKPSEEMTALFQEAGYESAQMALEQDGLAAALDVVSAAADGDNGKLQKLLGSTEAVAAANVIAGTGAEKMAEEIERQEGAAGAATDAYDTMNQTTSRAMEQLRTQFQNAAIEVGSEVLPKLNDVVRWGSDRLPGAIDTVKRVVGNLIDVIRGIADTVGDVVGFVDRNFQTLKTVFTILGGAMAVLFGPAMIARLVAWGTAQVVAAGKAVGAWVMTNAAAIKGAVVQSGAIAKTIARWAVMGAKSLVHAAKVAAAWLISIGPIALVIAAVVGLVILIVKNFDKIKKFIAGAWQWVQRITRRVWGAITGWLSRTWRSITGAVSRAWRSIIDAISRAWTRVKTATTNAIGSVLGWLRALPGRILSALGALAGSVLRFINRYHPVAILLRAVKGAAPGLIGFVRGLPSRILNGLGRIGSLLYNAGRKIIQGLIDGIKSMIGSVGSAIGSVASKVRDFLPFSPAKEGPLSGRGSPDLAGRRIGEMVAGGLTDSARRVSAASDRVAAAASVDGTGVGGAAARTNDRVAATSAAAAAADGRRTTIHVTAYDPAGAARALDRELGWQALAGRV